MVLPRAEKKLKTAILTVSVKNEYTRPARFNICKINRYRLIVIGQ